MSSTINSSPKLLYYWDSNVFISYLEATLDRITDIEAVIEEVLRNPASIIYTSAFSIVEVAFLSTEKGTRTLDSTILAKIDALWNTRPFQIVEFNPIIARLARDLVRNGFTDGYKLKPYDAIHIATAQWLTKNRIPLTEFHTYDDFDNKVEVIQRYSGLKIRPPKPFQPSLIIAGQ